MHKSIIVLLGLITFLIPLGPSSMSNSNVMAFEDYGYEVGQYENYAMDMANDNYYKSQNSDLIKKIKCNNINSNLNGVGATIGTDDSLGVGAAESILGDDASANWLGDGERKNGNFDLDCINNNNNAGGQGEGAIGPQGPQGPQGPAGPNQITTANKYKQFGPNVTSTPISSPFFGVIQVANSTATCLAGDIVLSGGYRINTVPPFSNVLHQISVKTEPTSTEDGWTVEIRTPVQFTLQSIAQCFDNPPLRTLATAAAVSTFQQPEDSSIKTQGIGATPKTAQATVASPVISQAIENSPKLTALEKQPADSSELTATEKITKLKQQWLELLP